MINQKFSINFPFPSFLHFPHSFLAFPNLSYHSYPSPPVPYPPLVPTLPHPFLSFPTLPFSTIPPVSTLPHPIALSTPFLHFPVRS